MRRYLVSIQFLSWDSFYYLSVGEGFLIKKTLPAVALHILTDMRKILHSPMLVRDHVDQALHALFGRDTHSIRSPKMADPLYELLLRLEHVAKLAQVGFGERLPFRFFWQGWARLLVFLPRYSSPPARTGPRRYVTGVFPVFRWGGR